MFTGIKTISSIVNKNKIIKPMFHLNRCGNVIRAILLLWIL